MNRIITFILLFFIISYSSACIDFNALESKLDVTPTSIKKQDLIIYPTPPRTSSLEDFKIFNDSSIDISFYIPEDWDYQVLDLEDLKNDKTFQNYFNFEGDYPEGHFFGFFPKKVPPYKLFTLISIDLKGQNIEVVEGMYQWIELTKTNLSTYDKSINFINSKVYSINGYPLAVIMYRGIESTLDLEMFTIVGRYQTNKYFYLIQLGSEPQFQNEMNDIFSVLCSILTIQ